MRWRTIAEWPYPATRIRLILSKTLMFLSGHAQSLPDGVVLMSTMMQSVIRFRERTESYEICVCNHRNLSRFYWIYIN